jgi:pyruvate/2-oxoglutarate dehydrogenase complex dihydrolipoamide dehydrogenase (E3) component
LPHEDRDIADAVRDVLTEDGIDVRLSSQVTAVSSSSRGNGGDVEVSVDREGKSTSVAGSHLLVAAGRVPNTDMLNLSSAGIETDSRGHIKADNKLRTTAPDVYVIGDVKGGPAFTHVSYDDYRVLTDQLFGTGAYTVDQRLLSYVVFMDPQLGRVGLSEQQARESGREVLIGTMPMTSVARALETDETRGMMKAVVDKDSGILLGASVLGIQGGELMSALQIAMMGNLHYSALRDAPFSHPTIAEAFNTLFASLQ